jgi:hypothetical protein
MENKRVQKMFLIVLLGSSLFLLPCIGQAEIPNKINYQGYLTSAAGSPVNGIVAMVFSFYTVSTGGSPIWTETQNVTVSSGVYNVNLGDVNPITTSLPFGLPYYLGVRVGTDSEMTPRIPLTSVGYAFRAHFANYVYGTGTFVNPIVSTVTTGTAPLQVTSTTNVTNFNADMLDGQHADAFAPVSHGHDSSAITSGVLPIERGGTGSGTKNFIDLSTDQTVAGVKTFNPSSGSVPFTVDATKQGMVTNFNSEMVGGKRLADLDSRYVPQRLVVVSPSGGENYTTIQAAIDAINPTAGKPYVVKVEPGTYVESLRMKSHVFLKGAGRDATILVPNTPNAQSTQDFNAINLENLTNVKISGFTIKGDGVMPYGWIGIYDLASSPHITESRITGFRVGCPECAGIYSSESSLTIMDNEFASNDLDLHLRGSSGTVTANLFFDNTGSSSGCNNIHLEGASTVVSRNTFTGRTGGILLTSFQGHVTSTIISENTFTDLHKAIDNGANRLGEFVTITNNVIGGTLNQSDYGIFSHGPTLIKGNRIENMGLFGVYSESDPTTIANNILIKAGINGGSAISVSSSPTIIGNIVDGGNGSGRGIASIDSGGKPVIGSNLIKNCGGGGISGSLMVISGNSIYSNGGHGIDGIGGAISGNNINSNGGDGILVTGGGSITGNTISANTGVCMNIPVSGVSTAGNLCSGNTGDP